MLVLKILNETEFTTRNGRGGNLACGYLVEVPGDVTGLRSLEKKIAQREVVNHWR